MGIIDGIANCWRKVCVESLSVLPIIDEHIFNW